MVGLGGMVMMEQAHLMQKVLVFILLLEVEVGIPNLGKKEEIVRKKEKENMGEEEQPNILLGKEVIIKPLEKKMEKKIMEEMVEVLGVIKCIVEGEVEMDIMVEVLVTMERKEMMVAAEEAQIIAKKYSHIKLNVF